MDSSEHIQVCFVRDSIYIYITMSINDEKVNNVNADKMMTGGHVHMNYNECYMFGLSLDALFS